MLLIFHLHECFPAVQFADKNRGEAKGKWEMHRDKSANTQSQTNKAEWQQINRPMDEQRQEAHWYVGDHVIWRRLTPIVYITLLMIHKTLCQHWLNYYAPKISSFILNRFKFGRRSADTVVDGALHHISNLGHKLSHSVFCQCNVFDWQENTTLGLDGIPSIILPTLRLNSVVGSCSEHRGRQEIAGHIHATHSHSHIKGQFRVPNTTKFLNYERKPHRYRESM